VAASPGPDPPALLGDLEDGEDLDVVGESNYHADLVAIMAALKPDPKATEVRCAALLVREPTNRYDKKAVMVVIHGKTVGYVPREDAAEIQPRLKRLEKKGQPVFVLARIGGGRVGNGGSVGPIGVSLETLPDNLFG
jgi:hypothetical protein